MPRNLDVHMDGLSLFILSQWGEGPAGVNGNFGR